MPLSSHESPGSFDTLFVLVLERIPRDANSVPRTGYLSRHPRHQPSFAAVTEGGYCSAFLALREAFLRHATRAPLDLIRVMAYSCKSDSPPGILCWPDFVYFCSFVPPFPTFLSLFLHHGPRHSFSFSLSLWSLPGITPSCLSSSLCIILLFSAPRCRPLSFQHYRSILPN